MRNLGYSSGYTSLGGSAGGPGVSDHGALTGLADNDHPQYAFALTSLGNLGATETFTIVPGGSVVVEGVLDQACVITLSGDTASTSGRLVARIKQNGTGGFAITWSGVKWPNSDTPTQSLGADDEDLYEFVSIGTDVYGAQVGTNYG
jgi:hypothetical protein